MPLKRDGQAFRWCVCALVLITAPAAARDRGTIIQGPARVIDGDTLDVSGIRVRLNGVAAPERGEAGGPEASAELQRIIGGQPVRCTLNGDRTHGREVGICRVGAVDVGAAVIAAGRARDCPRFSGGRYAGVEPPEAKRLPLPDYCG